MHDFVTMIWKEMIQVSNRPRFALQKAIVAALLAGTFALMAYGNIYSGPPTYQNMARFGREFYFLLIGILGVLMPLTAMAFGAEIVISEHVRKRLPLLLVTPLAAPAIVGSKIVSVFGRVVVGLLVSLPVIALLEIFGGVNTEMIVTGAAFVMGNIWLYGALGLACSVLSRSVVGALARAAALMVLWNLLPLVYAVFVEVRRFSAARPAASAARELVYGLSPFYCFVAIYEAAMGSPGPLVSIVTAHTAANLVLGLLFLVVAFVAFRPIARQFVSGAPERKRRFLTREKKIAAQKAAVAGVSSEPRLLRLSGRFDNCILEREVCRWRPWRLTLPLIWLFCPWVLVLFTASVSSDFPDFRNQDLQWGMFLAEAIGALFLMSLIAATRIAREKEARTFQVLVLTRMGALRIFIGKLTAIIVEQAVPLMLLAAHLVFIVWIEFPAPADVLVKALGFVVSVLFSITIGLYFSLSARTAVAGVIATAIAWVLGLYAAALPVLWLNNAFSESQADINLFTVIFPLLLIAGVSVLATAVLSRGQGYGTWLSFLGYSSVATLIYMAVAAAIDPSQSNDFLLPMAFIPAASLASWEWKVQQVSLPYMVLPVQIGTLLWMANAILLSFESQARREH